MKWIYSIGLLHCWMLYHNCIIYFFKKGDSYCTDFVGLHSLTVLTSCYLQAYTASFFAIPAFRWFLLQRRNAEIEQRNRARLGWVAALDRAGTELRQKVISQFRSYWAFVCFILSCPRTLSMIYHLIFYSCCNILSQ